MYNSKHKDFNVKFLKNFDFFMFFVIITNIGKDGV